MDEIVIDGSEGEGGGQILRTALALSLIAQRDLVVERIRARRKKPGLLRQHLTAVQAAQAIGDAAVEGATLGSDRLVFRPGPIRHGEHRFAIGTAGSTSLVLQTVLPALLSTPGQSRLTIEGGTHNPLAPTWDFLEQAFFPLLRRMGARVEGRLERAGFYPAGGGRVVVELEGGRLAPFELLERGPATERRAVALIANLPHVIAHRELQALQAQLSLDAKSLATVELPGPGPGNALSLSVGFAALTEHFSALGERGLSSEAVAERLVKEARRYLGTEVPVGEHLADQLLLPLALAGGGKFRTLRPSLHSTTNAQVIERFLKVAITFEIEGPDQCLVEVRPRAP